MIVAILSRLIGLCGLIGHADVPVCHTGRDFDRYVAGEMHVRCDRCGRIAWVRRS